MLKISKSGCGSLVEHYHYNSSCPSKHTQTHYSFNQFQISIHKRKRSTYLLLEKQHRPQRMHPE